MALKKQSALAPFTQRDPFALLRQMTAELDRAFDWPSFRMPLFRGPNGGDELPAWTPKIDVFERDNRLITRVDLPGLKKEDINVEVADGYLVLSGERKEEKEETKDNVYRAEREYGSFYRSVPLPEGTKAEDVKATFADGVLEVSTPLPPKAESKARRINVEAPAASGRSAA